MMSQEFRAGQKSERRKLALVGAAVFVSVVVLLAVLATVNLPLID